MEFDISSYIFNDSFTFKSSSRRENLKTSAISCQSEAGDRCASSLQGKGG